MAPRPQRATSAVNKAKLQLAGLRVKLSHLSSVLVCEGAQQAERVFADMRDSAALQQTVQATAQT